MSEAMGPVITDAELKAITKTANLFEAEDASLQVSHLYKSQLRHYQSQKAADKYVLFYTETFIILIFFPLDFTDSRGCCSRCSQGRTESESRGP